MGKTVCLALDLLAKYMDDWEPDKFCKAYVVGFLREAARLFAEDSYSPDREENYRQQLKYCREHDFICLESYRRHGAGKRVMVFRSATPAVQATADRRA